MNIRTLVKEVILMLRKNRVLFSSLIILVISTFLLSGCGGSKSGKGGGVDGGDPSVLHDFIGTWVSEGLNPASNCYH